MAFNFGAPTTGGTNLGFGNTQANSPAKPAVFGAPTTGGTGFGFGNTNTQANSPAKPGAFTFAATPTTPTPSFSLTSKNTTTTTPAFSFGGGTGTQASQTFSFGGQTQAATGGFSIAQAPTQDSSQVVARMNALSSQIDGGVYDRFNFAFYNKGDLSRHCKPNKMSESMWRDACARNPDPDTLVPVLAHGFNDLKIRRELQDKQRLQQEEMINNIGAHIEEQLIKQQIFQSRLAENRKTVARNIHRILAILNKVECLRRKGQALNRNEEHLFSQLEKMREELSKPGQYSSRANELMSNVKSQNVSDDDYPCLDDDSIVKVQDILSNFIVALSSIMKDVNNNAKALNLIEKSFQESAIESARK